MREQGREEDKGGGGRESRNREKFSEKMFETMAFGKVVSECYREARMRLKGSSERGRSLPRITQIRDRAGLELRI